MKTRSWPNVYRGSRYKMFLLIFFLLMSCTACHSTKELEDDSLFRLESRIPFSGKYVWSFEVPGEGIQTSSFIFFPDSMVYSMKGPVFETEYTQKLVGCDPAENRCITSGSGGSIAKDGVCFVMFFKDITDSTMAVYKHESKTGLKGAVDFKYPASDTEADHGWNVYKKAGNTGFVP